MQCPVDQTTLLMSERQGVEIDYCPQCRGVWLDRGELDKLIEKAPEPAPVERDRDRDRDWDRDRDRDRYRDDDVRSSYGRPHKKKKWLGEMFDFD